MYQYLIYIMSFTTILNIIVNFLSYLFFLFLDWLFIFISPIKNLYMLWIIVPIWINWFFTEFFQEKEGTSIGNAVTNGAVMLWVGIDLIRYLIENFIETKFILSITNITKILICIFIIAYGIFIVYHGIKRKNFIKIIGRVRETSYVLLMFSPIVYELIPINFRFFLGFVIFFPIWYFLIEYINKKKYSSKSSPSLNSNNFSSDKTLPDLQKKF